MLHAIKSPAKKKGRERESSEICSNIVTLALPDTRMKIHINIRKIIQIPRRAENVKTVIFEFSYFSRVYSSRMRKHYTCIKTPRPYTSDDRIFSSRQF